MSASETQSPAKSLLDFDVLKPEHAKEKVKKYLCGLKEPSEGGLPFEVQIQVGPVCFCKETFYWEGKGENAKQVFVKGSVYDLTDAQVKEVQEKLKHRYIRLRTTNGVLTGLEDVDASDGGDLSGTRPEKDGGSAPKRVPGRLRGDEVPLKNFLVFKQVYDNPTLNNRTVTVSDLKAMLAEAEAEEARLLEGDDSVFESGKGGKKAQKTADEKTLNALATTDGKRKAEGGYLGK